jgi:hypothetical protein
MRLPLCVRASNTNTVFECHGSLLLSPRITLRRRKDGDQGELLHYLTARRAVDELGASEPEGGLKPPSLGKDAKVPAFTAWIVDWAIRHIKETIPADWSLMVEVGFAYRYELPRPVWVPVSEIIGAVPADHDVKEGMVCIRYVVVSGHQDVLGISPCGKRSKGIDWKCGPVGADAAEYNWQAATYLSLTHIAYEPEESDFCLAQPLVDEEATGVPRISNVTLKGPQLAAMTREIAEQINKALEDRYTTNSAPKQCKWCPVALARPWDCPSLNAEELYMKAQIESGLLERLKAAPNDAALGDFVLSGRTIAGPVKEATELLHERLEANGYVDAACGKRITVKKQNGTIKILDPLAYYNRLAGVLPVERLALAVKPSKDRVIDQVAATLDLPKTSEKGHSATSWYEDNVKGFTEQETKRILVIQ